MCAIVWHLWQVLSGITVFAQPYGAGDILKKGTWLLFNVQRMYGVLADDMCAH